MPKYLLMENVKSIINKNHIDTFEKWKQRLENLGYESKQYVLNAADFGNCQNRERVFLLSILKDYKERINFEFKEIKGKKTKKPLSSILEKKNIQFNKKFNKYSLQAIKVNSSNIKKYLLKNYTNFQSENFVFDINYSGPTLTASGALSRIKLFYGKNKIREMLPIECFRYMGFSDKAYNLAKKTKLVNDNKLIYLCGNSINVKVLEAIFNNLEFE